MMIRCGLIVPNVFKTENVLRDWRKFKIGR